MLTYAVRVFFTILASFWLSSCGDPLNDELVKENQSFDEKKNIQIEPICWGTYLC